jgi:hypothetical protein
MRQKLLFFISILMLHFSSIGLAEDVVQDAPPLPAFSFGNESAVDKSPPDVSNKKSFFDKVKDFFGFSSDDAIKKDSGSSKAELVEDDDEPVLQAPVEPVMPAEDGAKISDEKQLDTAHSSVAESGPSEPSSPSNNIPAGDHSIFSSSRAKLEDASDLALPDGFEEFAEEKEKKVGDESNILEKKDDTPPAAPGLEGQGGVAAISAQPEVKESLPPVVDVSNQEVKSEPEVGVVITQNPEQELSLLVQDNDKSTDQTLPENQKQPEEKSVEPNTSESNEEKPVNAEKVDEVKVAAPNYVAEEGNKSIIDKYKTQLDTRKSAPQQVEQIAENELVIDNSHIGKFTEETAADVDGDTLQFVNNEAQVLLLPDDDVVEGKLTQEAKLNMMDLRSYIQLFWSKYDQAKRAYAAYKVNKFIDEYEDEPRVDYSSKDVIEALDNAFKAVDSGNTDSLISLLNAYPILHLTGPGGNNLLHEASYVGNYTAAKLLVLKGVNLQAKNAKKQTAMDIAKSANNKDIVDLLKSADARKKRYINLK